MTEVIAYIRWFDLVGSVYCNGLTRDLGPMKHRIELSCKQVRQRNKDREGYTLLLGMRSWEFAAFAAMRR